MCKLLVLVAAAALAPMAALAHHSPAAFDMRGEIVVEGTLAKVDWANPHVYLTIDTVGPGGQRIQQQVEAVSMSSVQAVGLTRDRLVIGSPVVVRAHPNRRGAGYTVLGADITLSDGSTYALGLAGRRSQPPVATQRASSLAGSWAPVVDPVLVPTVHGWPLTDKGRELLTSLLSGTRPDPATCAAAPPPMLMQLPQLRTIEVHDDRVVVKVDADGSDATRVIRLDVAAHPANVEPSLLGHSIGRWEGDTLVVDTVGFTEHSLGVGFGIPGGTGKHLVERLTLANGGLQLRYELTLEDPEYLTQPVTYTAMWDHRPDLAFSGAACSSEIAERFRED
jgi:hypothetical protein